jgi:hypothetical protein
VTPKFLLRHQDYVLGPNQEPGLASVAAGVQATICLVLDPDAPFELRSIAVRVAYNNSRQQANLQFLNFRYSGPDKDFRQQGRVPASIWMPYFGQNGCPHPVYPPITYPALGCIWVDLQNTGTSALTNLTFYFRGVKIYPPGTNPYYTYPPKFSTIAYTDRVDVSNVLNIDNGGHFNQIFPYPGPGGNPQKDSDFVLRAIQIGRPAVPQYNELFIKLRDENNKAYSNDWVHVDVLAGNATGQTGAYTSGAAVGTGPSHPGVFYPEIYLPKNHILVYDIMRNDPGLSTLNLPMAFIGAKVFHK